MFCRKHGTAFDQVSEFDRGRIAAYRDFGLSFGQIGSRVVRNKTTVMRICDRRMKEAEWSVHKTSILQNHRRLRRQWCDKKGYGRQNGMLSLLTNHASVCNTTMVEFESGDTVE
ncbi:HTH_38 domain-containing protein [Trichonephila clavipes]|nr:HTH_38 domain-containing protein [Trichonephila clavipes]